jgi:dolichol-phosphate mannosyltransferase
MQRLDQFRIINLGINVGHMNAIRAGLEASHGEYVVTIDADLQDPPEAIPEMLKIITSKTEGYNQNFTERHEKVSNSCDVVQAFRSDRTSDSFWKKWTAALYYKVIKRITGISLIPHAADYRIMKRHVVNQLLELPEKRLVFRLLIPSLGFQVIPYPIQRGKRYAGKTKYTNRKMIALAIDSIIGFTNRPLRFLAFIGFFSSGMLLIGSISTLLIYLFGNTLPGWPSLVLLLLSFNAFLFAGLGLVGEYVGRIYQLIQARPTVRWKEL